MATVMKREEQITFALRSLYKQYGYLPYKMSKFEAYDLYVANKEFLRSDGVITFNDTDGKLLALKPDVTLSIIKNGNDVGKQKVYYNENVYRISGETKQFKEIMQVGLEHVGEISAYDVYETVLLAAKSLAEISPDFVLDISHLGILSAVLETLGAGEKFDRLVMKLIGDKNVHETQALCKEYGVSEADTRKLLTLLRAYGDMDTVLETLRPVCEKGKAAEAYGELVTLCSLLAESGYGDKIRVDFSVINDMNYYNGIVFKGFIDGVCEGVLSGGQYDKLMARMGRKSGAIGFAVYLDLLQSFGAVKEDTDVDALVLVDENTPIEKIVAAVAELQSEGASVRVQKQKGELRCKRICDLRKEGGEK